MPQVPHIEPGPDTIRILLTTDNHVGYNEADPVRGDDAWRTFEEIMNIAKDQDVDMVLQAGDLFHINKPTKKSMYHVMRIIRRTCFGDKPCELELLSDPQLVFDDGFNTVNYEDPNLNISIPIFSISGNHDDASGNGLLSPLDLLGVSGLVNHFGRVTQNDQINITPLLLQKGLTKLSLFGMASVRDERLFKTFRDKKVKFLVPQIQNDEWFNLMCVHQNHAVRPNTAYLPEHFLPSFLDLVLWGHEHECIPRAVYNPTAGFDVLQPGSSVATSLSSGEALEKKVFILNVQGKDYSLEPFTLKTVRPFQMEEIALSTVHGLRPGMAYKNETTQFLIDKVESLIKKAHDEFEELNPGMDMPLPLVRLRVDYTGGFEVENPRRFSNRFVGRVANVNTVIQFHRKQEVSRSSKIKISTETGDEDDDNVNIEAFINNYLEKTELGILPETGFNDALRRFVEKDDKTAIKDFIDTELQDELHNFLQNEDVDLEEDENLSTLMKKFKKERSDYVSQRRSASVGQDTPKAAIEPPKATGSSSKPASKTSKTSTTRTSTKAAPRRKAPAKKTAKSKDFVVDSDEEIVSENEKGDSESDFDPEPAHAPRKRAARSSRGKPKPTESIEVPDSDIEVLSDEPEVIMSSEEEFEEPPTKRKAPARSTGKKAPAKKAPAAPKKTSRKTRTPETPVTDTIANLLARKRR